MFRGKIRPSFIRQVGLLMDGQRKKLGFAPCNCIFADKQANQATGHDEMQEASTCRAEDARMEELSKPPLSSGCNIPLTLWYGVGWTSEA
jgi:hypothetical protein